MTSFNSLIVFFVLAACSVGDDPGTPCSGTSCGGNVTPDQTCSDPRYGDGTCQIALDCAVPDIDCFKLFPDDASAAPWFSTWEADTAMGEGRPPRATLPTTDPRFQRVRALLDRGWDAFKTQRPVGKLADKRPALVLVDDPTVNAFVIPDTASDTSGFAVMVHSGLADRMDFTDDASLGLMMHELQHAVGLHTIHNHGDELRKFYIAKDGAEPIGQAQSDDPSVHSAGMAWRELAVDVGPFSNEELGGLSINGQMDQVFRAGLRLAHQQNAAACEAAAPGVEALLQDIGASIDELDTHLTIDLDSLAYRVDDAMWDLDDCFYGFDMSVADVVAQLKHTTTAAVEAGFSPSDLALEHGKPFFDGLTALVEARRSAMRDIERAYVAVSGQPWSTLRFFSFEEDADDTTVPVLSGAGLEPTGAGEFLIDILSPAGKTECQARIARGAVGYGLDLTDEHHATCWRVTNISRVAAAQPHIAPLPTALPPIVPASVGAPHHFEVLDQRHRAVY